MCDNIALKKCFWDSKSEKYSYYFLKKHLTTESYEILPHVVLRDIFDNLDNSIKNMHVDFLIVTTDGYPVLGIEINGHHHQNSKDYKAKDEKKQKLFSSFSIPLVFIPLGEIADLIEEFEEKYLPELEDILITFLKQFCYHISIIAYCKHCGNKMDFYYNNEPNPTKHKSNKFYLCDSCNKLNYKVSYVDSIDIPLIFDFRDSKKNDKKATEQQ